MALEPKVAITENGYIVAGCGDDLDRKIAAFFRTVELRGLSVRTSRAYAYDLLCFFRWLGSTGKAFEDLTQTDFVEFIAAQRGAHAKPKSINRRLTTAHLLFRCSYGRSVPGAPGSAFPAANGWWGASVYDSLGVSRIRVRRHNPLKVKVPRVIVEPLAADEVNALIKTLSRYRDIAIVSLMLLCGLRSIEILSVEVQDVDLVERSVRIRGKGNRERMMPLPELIVTTLERYMNIERPRRVATDQLFIILQGKSRGRPMTPAGIRSLFRCRRVTPLLRRANPHRLRHTFGADMARSGINLPVLQRMMGHADSRTTLQYIYLSMSDIAIEYRRAMKNIQERYDKLT